MSTPVVEIEGLPGTWLFLSSGFIVLCVFIAMFLLGRLLVAVEDIAEAQAIRCEDSP